MSNTMLAGLIAEFQKQYNAPIKDSIWKQQSAAFRQFWTQRVMAPCLPVWTIGNDLRGIEVHGIALQNMMTNARKLFDWGKLPVHALEGGNR